jgi:hypothetical protein
LIIKENKIKKKIKNMSPSSNGKWWVLVLFKKYVLVMEGGRVDAFKKK